MDAFISTHEIHIVRRGKLDVIPVCLVEGACYTQAEWQAHDKADWTLDNEGLLTFQGEIPICDEYTIEVRK